MPGPPKTPTPILEARGSWRAKARKGEPQPAGALPKAPSWLTKKQGDAYRQVCEQLADLGVGKQPDAKAIIRYAVTWCRWREAIEQLAQEGETYTTTTPSGDEMHRLNPLASLANDLAGQLLRIEQEFGLTPAARAKIQVESPTDKTPALKARYFEDAG